MCEYNRQDSEIIYSEYFNYVSNLNSNLTEPQIRKIDELNTLINQNSSFATQKIVDEIMNLTCKK
jgi:hypothetical protein